MKDVVHCPVNLEVKCELIGIKGRLRKFVIYPRYRHSGREIWNKDWNTSLKYLIFLNEMPTFDNIWKYFVWLNERFSK